MNPKEYRPTLAQLRTFVTIAEQKHFGTAAAKLGISQPSLSQALASLEQGVGVQLIERSTRRVITTSAGQRLLPYARATLEAAEAFMANALGIGEPLTGPMVIGVIPTAAPYILPAALGLMAERYPDLKPRIVEEPTAHLAERLRDGSVDAALLALPSEINGVTDVPLYEEPFSLVVPDNHPLAGATSLTFDDLNKVTLLLLDDGHCLRDQVLDLCRQGRVSVNSSTDSLTRAASLTTVIQLVAGGLGATLVPESALAFEGHRPGLATARFDSSISAQRQMGLVYRSSSARGEEFAAMGALLAEAYRRSVEA